MSKLVYSLVLRKPLFKKESLSLSWCYSPFVPITAHFHCQTHFPNFRNASNQNTTATTPLNESSKVSQSSTTNIMSSTSSKNVANGTEITNDAYEIAGIHFNPIRDMLLFLT